MSRKRILWLASWYPNRYDQFNGDFIQRHAHAASIDNDIHVIYLHDASDLISTEEEVKIQEGLTEQIIYYKKGGGLTGKLIKQIRFFTIYKKAIRGYIKNNGLPHCVHVHVPWKAGLLALWIKRKYGVPYLVTEHWDIYNKIVDDNYFKRPFYFKKLLYYIIHESKMLLTVSNFIAYSINSLVAKKKFVFVPNAVDTRIFRYSIEKYSKFTFLHVSNMADKKNVDGILKAFFLFLNETKAEVQLFLAGNKDSYYEKKANELGLLEPYVSFKGEISYESIAKEMQQSHCLILNSIIENSPCVIGEALCCGLPVIATNVGGIPELTNNINGILIDPLKTIDLVNAMKEVYYNYPCFNVFDESEKAKQKFGFEVVSEMLDNNYSLLSS